MSKITTAISLSTAKQGDNALGSVRPFVRVFVRVFVCALLLELFTSLRYLSVSVNVGHLRLISRMRSIGF